MHLKKTEPKCSQQHFVPIVVKIKWFSSSFMRQIYEAFMEGLVLIQKGTFMSLSKLFGGRELFGISCFLEHRRFNLHHVIVE
jgi:hypothetical protein